MDDNQSLLQQVLDRYGLSTSRAFSLHSYNNQVYRIENADKQSFSLRICGFLNMKHHSMEDEMRWLDFVAQRNPRLAPRPIANQQGELVTVVATPAGDRLACLFAWIEGG
jgi:Ser/Thr protein kinase RdoA (MazF antagonist)